MAMDVRIATDCHKMSGVDHLQVSVLKVREHSELLSAQYLARYMELGNVSNSITTRDKPKRQRKTVEPMMVANDRKATLQAIHTSAVNQAVNRQEVNVVLDDRPPLINKRI